MAIGSTAEWSGDGSNARNGTKRIKASSDVRPQISSAAMFRRARELRYSRDEGELSASLSSCAEEPSVEQLQKTALEQVREELESRVRGYDQRVHELREGLAGQPDGDESRESLLRQRLVIEHGLAVAREELSAVIKELERLRLSISPSRPNSLDRGSSSSGASSRGEENLSLFFRNSATMRPLPKPTRPYSADYVHRAGLSAPRKCGQINTHLRSKSLMEVYVPEKLRVSDQRLRPGSSSFPGSASAMPRTDPHPSRVVPAVDEFNNSFSSRVIAAPSSRPKQRSSLRALQIPTNERRRLFTDKSRRSLAVRSEYGNVTLLPHVMPRSTSDLLDDLPSAPLPAYVHNLMDEFEQASQPSLAFSLMENKVLGSPVLRKPAPLSPVLEQPSPFSSIKSRDLPKSSGRKLVKKDLSIFTLRLTSRPPAPSSSSLAASSSTSVDASSEEHPLPIPFVDSTVTLRPKGLPSTRNHDLAMLDAAPDDIPATPRIHESVPPSSAKRTSRSIAVLRRVKGRLFQLGRH